MNISIINSIIGIVILGFCSTPLQSLAQIVPDNTIPTQVKNNVDIKGLPSVVIDGGAVKGSNLFHSFNEFNIESGRGTYFAHPDGITNILTRVTGSKASNINGTLGVLGNANLFLLNPNGIIFGTNARLEMSGSFLATTASSINFADGTKFSTTDRVSNPLLTISTPVGLNLNSKATVQVNGTGDSSTSQGLTVAPEKTLALVGGNVSLNGGLITVPSGRVEIGGVENGNVSINYAATGWSLGYNQVEKFGDIQLLNRANVLNISNLDSNFSQQGAVLVRGGNVTLDGGSQITSLTPGNQPGINIDIKANQSLNVGGSDNIQPTSSRIRSVVAANALAMGGDILVTTSNLKITDGGRIETISLGKGNAGNIDIQSGTIYIKGFSSYQSQQNVTEPLNSGVDSGNLNAGTGGNINISSQKITLLDGGFISTFVSPFATGAGGNINIKATESITSKGTNRLNPIFSSGITAISFGAGASGNIRVLTKQLDLQQGGVVQSSAYGSGKGGSIDINATESIYATDDNPLIKGVSSGINASTFGTNNGGDIHVSTDKLQLFDGADISSFSSNQPLGGILISGSGTGNGGNITVNARTIEIAGVSPLAPDTNTGLSSVTFGSGRSGDVKVSAQRLIVKDGASISTAVLVGALSLGVPAPGAGKGEGGNLSIDADEIEVLGTNKFFSASTNIVTASSGEGKGGDTLINTRNLVIQDGARVGSITAAKGNAGNVKVYANTVRILGVGTGGIPSEISSNALLFSDEVRSFYFLPPVPSGNTGQVDINAQKIFVNNGARISVQHDGTGNAGKIKITTNNLKLDHGNIQATSNSGKGGDINLQTKLLQMQGNSTITATAYNQGNGGNIIVDTQLFVQLENSDIIAQAFDGRGGNIKINTQGILGGQFSSKLTSQSDITASSEYGINGVVQLNVPQADITQGVNTFKLSFADNDTKVTNTCSRVNENKFTISGRGGLPSSPIESLLGETIWQDVRNNHHAVSEPQKRELSKVNNNLDIVEAQGWLVDNKGKVELVTNFSSSTAHSNWYSVPNCKPLSPA
jgi:filamentous hemagglutinin family protein